MAWTEPQEVAISERNTDYLVLSAAAGAGKTAVLVERVIQKILEGVPIDRLLIVTFTNAAANSMRARILNSLREAVAQNPRNAMLERQIALLPRANISTIHAFCQTLLRNNFYTLGIPAAFTIIDENRARTLESQAVDTILQKAYLKGDSAFADLVTNFGGRRGDTELEEVICRLYKFSQAAADPSEWLMKKITPEQAANVVLEHFYDDLISAQDLLSQAIEVAEEPHASVLEAEREFFRDITSKSADAGKMWDEIHAIMTTHKFRTMPPRAPEEVKKLRDKAKKIWNSHSCFMRSFEQMSKDIDVMEPQRMALCSLAADFSDEFARLKLQENSLDFNDLEHMTIRLLGMQGKEIAEKFDEVYVDEFQDTNAAQAQIFDTLAQHTKMFIVGDVKQSIYRFRNAQPQIFSARINGEKSLPNARVLHLPHNFRSTPQVIDVVNHIFSQIMSEKVGEVDYNESHALIAGDKEGETSGDTQGDTANAQGDIANVQGDTANAQGDIANAQEDTANAQGDTTNTQGSMGDVQESAGDACEIHMIERDCDDLPPMRREARFVANRIIELKQDNPNLKFSDIAILTRKATGVVDAFTHELARAGIPIISDDSTGFFSADDVQNMVALLEVVDNSWQDIPLVACMRSDIFEFTDEELAKIRLKTPTGPFYEAVENFGDEKCAAFVEKIAKYTQIVRKASLAELLDNIFLDIGLKKLTPNMQAIRSFAEEFERDEKRSLSDFNAYLSACIDNRLEFASPKVLAPSSDAVRIMTIHKSKGLEFDTVFLVGTGTKFNLRDVSSRILYDFSNGVALDFVNRERNIARPSLSRRMIALSKKSEMISEEMRILYVALTRAISRICIVGTCKDEPRENSFLHWLAKVGLPVIRHDEIPEPNARLAETSCIQAESPDEVLEQSPGTPLKLSVSEILSGSINAQQKIADKSVESSTCSGVDKSVAYSGIDKGAAYSGIDKGAAYRGTVVHFVMQNIDISRTDSLANIQEQIREMRNKRMFGEKEESLVSAEKILGFFQSELGKRLKKSPNVHREVKFFTDLDIGDFETHVQGVIDCFFEEDGEIVVIDFKTGTRAAQSTQSAMQVKLYSQAIEKITGKRVKECVVYGGL